MNASTKPHFFMSAMAKLAALAMAMQRGTSGDVANIMAMPVREKSKKSPYRPSGVLKAKRAAKKARKVKRMKRK